MARRDNVVTPDVWMNRGEAICTGLHPPVAVWQGIPGERCQIHVYGRGKNRSQARWETALGKPHPHRVEPPCDRYSVCGGCPFMHLNAAGQREARLALVRAAYEQYGLGQHAPKELRPSPDGLEGYRHLVKLAVGRSDRGSARVGAFGRSTRNVVPIPHCSVITPTLRELMGLVAHTVREQDIWPWDPELERGVLRYVVMRQSRSTGKVLVTLVGARKSPKFRDLAETLVQQHGAVTGVHLHINSSPGNALFEPAEDGGIPTVRLEGDRLIEEAIAGLRLPIGAGDFFQTNPAVAELIMRDLEGWIPTDRPVLDLYSGVGGLSLVAARRAGWALGVEAVETAVKRARSAASLNGLPAEFLVGEVLDSLPEIRRRLAGRAPVVVVNPARRGLEPGVIDGLRELSPSRLVYISCNAVSQARDLELLGEAGFGVHHSMAYDMFPNTPHAEVMAVLKGPSGGTRPSARPPRRHLVRRK
jgi:23S rRNA (uracil1939-C5)-methyltransferase